MPETEYSQKIRTSLVVILYRQSPILFSVSMAGIIIVIDALRNQVPYRTLATWSCLTLVASLILAVIWWYQRHRPVTPDRSVFRGRLFTVAGLILGCSWGAAGLILFPHAELSSQLVLAAVLYIAAAAFLAATAIYPPAFFSGITTILLPVTVYSLFFGDHPHQVVGVLGLAYLLLLALFGNNIHRLIKNSLLLQFEKEQLAVALEQKQLAAERASRDKSRFLAAASHDLRQPLHALGLFVEALGNTSNTQESARLITKIQASTTALEDLFNGLLDISRLDAGVVVPAISSFKVSRILHRLSEDFTSVAASKGLKFSVVDSSAVIRSDPVLLDRITRNLVSNAVKYTRSGGVVVGCRPRHDHILVEVHDTGIGIPENLKKDIFQEFFQLRNPERDRQKGLGLGLAIVWRTALLLDHPVRIRKRKGNGTVFSVEIPRCDSTTIIAASDNQGLTVTPAGFKDCKIMVIEDDPAVRDAMQVLLSDWGCTVSLARSLSDALDMAGNIAVPDIIIADYRLPELVTGLQVIGELKQCFNHDIPAILVSGDIDKDSLRSVELSGYQLLHKPVRPAKLRAMLAHLL